MLLGEAGTGTGTSTSTAAAAAGGGAGGAAVDVSLIPFEFDPPGTYPPEGQDWTEYCTSYGPPKARFLLEQKLPRAFELGAAGPCRPYPPAPRKRIHVPQKTADFGKKKSLESSP